MGQIPINGSSQITMAEVPYIKLQRIPDFILDVIDNSLSDQIKKAVLAQDIVGLHSWMRRNLDSLEKGGKILKSGDLNRYWGDYLQQFDKAGVSANKTRAALLKFQTAACVGKSYVKLPHAANLAKFYDKASEVPLPQATAQEISDKRGEPNYGNYIEGKISDMVAQYKKMQFNRRVANTGKRSQFSLAGHRDAGS
ncbi:hypothetical protein KUV62_13570 [Salipiger bermudensis]|uniref:hypothetical protein n=1 Tax=Salipiger bermudensis TaxID=344736 RepID=UPI001C992E29|nr:hypothetical protein [Salipiger bermudensis]MBY6004944.1 hypothetical protein [Salipiger bermudensis]